MNKFEVVGQIAKSFIKPIDRLRRGVRLVKERETGRTVEVPWDLTPEDAQDYAFSAALTQATQERIKSDKV